MKIYDPIQISSEGSPTVIFQKKQNFQEKNKLFTNSRNLGCETRTNIIFCPLRHQEPAQIHDHDGDVVPAPPASGHGDQLLARRRRPVRGEHDVDRLLARHLVPEAVGGEDEEAAVRRDAAARDLRLARDPGLHGRVTERARHGQAVLHAPHAAAAAAHVPALRCTTGQLDIYA
jgi:hypothetical protein